MIDELQICTINLIGERICAEGESALIGMGSLAGFTGILFLIETLRERKKETKNV